MGLDVADSRRACDGQSHGHSEHARVSAQMHR
jgi:hypothetical protein